MARLPRFVLVGHPQHVIVRGNNRAPIFYEKGGINFVLISYGRLVISIIVIFMPMY